MANFLSLVLSANVRQFNADMKSARKTAEDSFGAIRQTAEEAGKGAAIGFGALAAGGVALTTSFLKAAATMQDYKSTLEAMYGSSEIAAEKLAYFVKVAATTPFELAEIVQAGIRIKGLGQEVEKVLPKVINLAAGLKKDLGETALTVAKAIGGSRDALLQLRDTYAITTNQLKQFGAVVNKQNEIVNEGVEEAEKLKIALFGVIEAKFGDIVGKQADNLSVAFSGLRDSVFQVAAGLGQQLGPSAVKVSRVLTGLLNSFNELSPATKNIIATSVVVGTAMAGAAAGIGALGAAIAVATPAIAAIAGSSALAGLAATLGTTVGPLIALTVAMTGLAAASVGLAAEADGIKEFASQTALGATALETFTYWARRFKEIGDLKIPKLTNLPNDTELSLRQVGEAFGKVGKQASQYTDPLTSGLKLAAKAYGELTEAGSKSEKELKKQQDLLKFYTENKNLIGKTAAEVAFRGKTEEDLNKLLEFRQGLASKDREIAKKAYDDWVRLKAVANDPGVFAERRANAEAQAKEAYTQKFYAEKRAIDNEREIEQLKQTAKQLDGLAASRKAFNESPSQVANADAPRKAAFAASRAYKQFNQDQRDGIFASKREELDKLKEIEAANYKYAAAVKNSDETLYKQLLSNATNLEIEKKKLKRAADKEAFDEQFKLIERNRLAGKLTFDGAAEAYQKLGDKFSGKGAFFVAGAQAQAYAKVEEQTVLAIKQRIDTEQLAIKVNQQLSEQRSVTAEKDIVLGKNVAENEKIVLETIKERLDLEARSIQLNAQKEVLDSDKSSEAVAQITKKAEFDLLKARQEATNQTLALEAKIRQSKVETLKIENELRTATKSGVDAEIDLLQRRLQGGEDVSDSLRKQLALRQQLDQQIIEGNRQQQLEANPERRDVLEKRFAQERIAEDKKAKLAKKASDDEIARADIARSQKALDLKKAEFQAQKDLVDQQKESGVDAADREVQLRRQALDLAIEEVKIRVANDSVGKTAADVTTTQKIAEIEIQKLRKDALKDIQNINDAFKGGTKELEKQRDLLKGIVDELTKLENEDAAAKKNGGILGGVEEFAKASKRESDIFDLKSQKRRLEGSINDSERSKKGQLLNQLENERTGRTVGGLTVNETIQQNERQAREDAVRQKQEAINEQQRLKGRAEAEKRLRSDGVVRSDEEINRILGINFKAPAEDKETAARKAAKKGGIPGLEDPALQVGNPGPGTDKILMDILQAITTALNRQGVTPPPPVGPPGSKPQNQTPKKKNDMAVQSQLGNYGPYPS